MSCNAARRPRGSSFTRGIPTPFRPGGTSRDDHVVPIVGARAVYTKGLGEKQSLAREHRSHDDTCRSDRCHQRRTHGVEDRCGAACAGTERASATVPSGPHADGRSESVVKWALHSRSRRWSLVLKPFAVDASANACAAAPYGVARLSTRAGMLFSAHWMPRNPSPTDVEAIPWAGMITAQIPGVTKHHTENDAPGGKPQRMAPGFSTDPQVIHRRGRHAAAPRRSRRARRILVVRLRIASSLRRGTPDAGV